MVYFLQQVIYFILNITKYSLYFKGLLSWQKLSDRFGLSDVIIQVAEHFLKLPLFRKESNKRLFVLLAVNISSIRRLTATKLTKNN